MTARNNSTLMFNNIKKITYELFKKEDKRLSDSLDRIYDENLNLSDTSIDAFLFNGKVYRKSNYALGGSVRRPLHLSLHDKMKYHLFDKDIIDTDKKKISQILYILLQPARNAQEFHDTLPSCLDDITTGIQGVGPRIYNEACTIEDNPKALKQYEDILPKIITYATARLIY